jgi:hypothetical protein
MSFFEDLVDGTRLPMLLLFAAFMITFVITRTITRMIRSGRGPFHDNVAGGVHIHHAIPGIVLTIGGGFVSVGAHGSAPWAEISAVMIGVGSSLVLDEFAMILHLQDVYWSAEGQLSVQVVALTGSLLGLVLLGIDPIVSNVGTPGHFVLLGTIPFHILALLICVEKGKYQTAAIGAFIPPVAWVGAVRLARPKSRWARKHYSESTLQRAQKHAEWFDDGFGRWGLDIEDLVAGKPSKTT